MSSEEIDAAKKALSEAYNAFDQAFDRAWQLAVELPLAPANYALHDDAGERMVEARAKYYAAIATCVELGVDLRAFRP